ncbi:ExbD/TolR family protein [Desulfoluna butyratoxydans]|uniref:Biopolymer transport protein exbd/tolr n=1 Tax=Desulfoluna butyratoxydans TaxID=231438 RepID=A0A4U8YTT8_9BACT|nr:biopolymer transporter ExbD [Desulfoluna butyratoxydans]VFQ46789.1 biopolymer transport protein exbd/tolr [Desulfoluna butyratoxydans]
MKVKRDFSIKNKPDMLPLIDVVFLLLVFFIYAMLSMSYHNGIRLELPESAQAEHMEEATELIISVEADGRVYMGKEEVMLTDLGTRVKRYFEGKKKKQVILSGHKDLSYQNLFHVMDTIRGAGICDIALQAEVAKP